MGIFCYSKVEQLISTKNQKTKKNQYLKPEHLGRFDAYLYSSTRHTKCQI